MNSSNVYTEYNDEKNQIPWLRMIITAFIIALIIFIILLLLRNCGKSSLRGDLVEAAQEYYEKYPTSLPKEVGECYVVTLATLEKEGLIDPSKYSTCDKTKTYVNVCYLENLKYNYAATLACEVETTEYDMWKDGSVNDLVEGSDVRFKFLGEQFTLVEDTESNNITKYYYPTNTTNPDEVNTYYTTVPATGYTEKDGQATGYKWYTESQGKSYWNNGEYSATAPSGYVNRDSEKQVTSYSETRPADASYRTITEISLYRFKKVATPYLYVCVVPGSTNGIKIQSPNHCALNKEGFTKVEKAYYSCDGGATNVEFGTVCNDYTDYSETACTTNNSQGIICESKGGYKYTDTVYKWYKNTTVKKYYPSNSTNVNKENTYYITAPVSGAIRDDSTEAQVYKFYKTDSGTGVNMVEKWVDVTNGYVELDELINTFNKLGYNVNNLSDIKAIEDIRYQLKMQYRNVEE